VGATLTTIRAQFRARDGRAGANSEASSSNSSPAPLGRPGFLPPARNDEIGPASGLLGPKQTVNVRFYRGSPTTHHRLPHPVNSSPGALDPLSASEYSPCPQSRAFAARHGFRFSSSTGPDLGGPGSPKNPPLSRLSIATRRMDEEAPPENPIAGRSQPRDGWPLGRRKLISVGVLRDGQSAAPRPRATVHSRQGSQHLIACHRTGPTGKTVDRKVSPGARVGSEFGGSPAIRLRRDPFRSAPCRPPLAAHRRNNPVAPTMMIRPARRDHRIDTSTDSPVNCV